MRICSLVLCTACGGGSGGLEPPDDCQPQRLHYIHDLRLGDIQAGEGDLSITGHSFINKVNETEPGTLEIGDLRGTMGGARIYLEFDQLLSSSASVAARGFVKLPDQMIEVGNCETGALSGELAEITNGDGWKFTLVDVHAAPYCSGAAISGSFAACFRAR